MLRRHLAEIGPLALLALTLSGASFLACGGKVAFDGLPGAGGATSSTSSTTSSTTTSSATHASSSSSGEITCMSPPPPGSLTPCGGSAVSSGTGGIQCDTEWCDAQSNTYGSTCQDQACVCTRNGQTMCTCVLNGPGTVCVDTPSCCPWVSTM